MSTETATGPLAGDPHDADPRDADPHDAGPRDAVPRDAGLTAELTALLGRTPGVADVFDARPRREVAAAAVVGGIEHGLEALGVDVDEESSGAGPRGTVHVERHADGHGSVTAHVATSVTAATPDVLAGAATRLREHLAGRGEDLDGWTVHVVARLVDDA